MFLLLFPFPLRYRLWERWSEEIKHLLQTHHQIFGMGFCEREWKSWVEVRFQDVPLPTAFKIKDAQKGVRKNKQWHPYYLFIFFYPGRISYETNTPFQGWNVCFFYGLLLLSVPPPQTTMEGWGTPPSSSKAVSTFHEAKMLRTPQLNRIQAAMFFFFWSPWAAKNVCVTRTPHVLKTYRQAFTSTTRDVGAGKRCVPGTTKNKPIFY